MLSSCIRRAAIFILVSAFVVTGVLAWQAAHAAGGQNQWNNPIFAEGCVAELPAGIDLGTCESVPTETGLITYYCKGEVITVNCQDDSPQAPGQSK